MERVIGAYTGEEKGPLLICLGGIHGNETAGIEALLEVFQRLEEEPSKNPNFHFRGRIVGLRGNLQALANGIRFIEADMNRMWTPENVKRILETSESLLLSEEQEVKYLYKEILEQIDSYEFDRLLIMDLHTTTALGGIFSICTDDPESLKIANELHAPVITGMLRNISGTTMHFFSKDNFDYDLVAVCFESGQHDAHDSKGNAVAAVINCLRTIGCVDPKDVENVHDNRLIKKSDNLPKVTELTYCHSIREEDAFEMKPGYLNFQSIKKGELLAHDRNGAIYSEYDGLILMPLYQPIGEDGFFVVQVVD